MELSATNIAENGISESIVRFRFQVSDVIRSYDSMIIGLTHLQDFYFTDYLIFTMVRVSLLAAALVSALSGLAAAKSCKKGGLYCGSALLKKGDYITKMNTNLEANNLDPTEMNRERTLWVCIEHGDIKLLETCMMTCLSGTPEDDSCGEEEAAKIAAGAKRAVAMNWAA
ncbi:hypothetical protein VTL71DRAFT_1310 [Oculimacula yallundae]|uniref:Uncharacterized protein n=1 Tax=Oculimacula yallundae TaxID=86028 RepID=A0ABR4CC97_9HELO